MVKNEWENDDFFWYEFHEIAADNQFMERFPNFTIHFFQIIFINKITCIRFLDAYCLWE